jgi:nucleotide-binding universal stress UspA family protein
MYSQLLVPLDGSKTAEKALPYARTLASKFKLPVELLTVIDITELATRLSPERARHPCPSDLKSWRNSSLKLFES